MARHYYAIRRMYKNGAPQTPANYPYDTEALAEKQFHLLCASAISNDNGYDFEAVEYGTVEKGALDRKYYSHPAPEPETEET